MAQIQSLSTARGWLRRSHFQGREARRPAGASANKVRPCDQHQESLPRHPPPSALGVCDMVLEVKDGRLVAPHLTGRSHEVIAGADERAVPEASLETPCGSSSPGPPRSEPPSLSEKRDRCQRNPSRIPTGRP